MAVDWTGTDASTPHLQVLDNLLARDASNATQDYTADSHVIDKTIRFNRAGRFEEYAAASSTWVPVVIAIDGGGTGSTSPGGIRGNLGLGTLATQNANAVAITGGSVAANLGGSTNVAASSITGVINQQNLGSGADGVGQKVLADNQRWVVAVPAGSIFEYGGAAAPPGYLLCDGASYLRASYPDLFAAIGGTYGAVDGAHFSVPDARGRVSIGAGAGPGLTARGLGAILGEESHVISTNEMASHGHVGHGTSDVTDPGHLHGIPGRLTGGSYQGPTNFFDMGTTTNYWDGNYPVSTQRGPTGISVKTTVTVDPIGGNAAHNNMQPSIALNKIIKY